MRRGRLLQSGLSGVSRILDMACEWAHALIGCCIVLGWWLAFYLLEGMR